MKNSVLQLSWPYPEGGGTWGVGSVSPAKCSLLLQQWLTPCRSHRFEHSPERGHAGSSSFRALGLGEGVLEQGLWGAGNAGCWELMWCQHPLSSLLAGGGVDPCSPRFL